MNKLLIVFGTRPELIKLLPVIHEFTKRGLRKHLYIVNANQHKELLQKELAYFQLKVDYTFQLNRENDHLTLLNGLLLLEFEKLQQKFTKKKIHILAAIAQGDTCTTFSTAQFCFYEKIPFVHVEAGLRTGDFENPFPEEFYRKTIASIADVHFAPTAIAKKNLLMEGISSTCVFQTGNTVIDHLKKYIPQKENQALSLAEKKIVLITIHRRENRDAKLDSIMKSIISLAKKNSQKTFVWIKHPSMPISTALTIPYNMKFIAPVSYVEMCGWYQKTAMIITDSGGIQEEATFLGIPTLICRLKTERVEGIELGTAQYLTNKNISIDSIINEYGKKSNTKSQQIYGDGNASKKIVDMVFTKYWK
jgi:UDP-N-acetylglucosamine 2-epimerase (non-hydrolysing)